MWNCYGNLIPNSKLFLTGVKEHLLWKNFLI